MRGVINSGSIRLLWLLGLVVSLICQSAEGQAGDERKQLAFDAVDHLEGEVLALIGHCHARERLKNEQQGKQ